MTGERQLQSEEDGQFRGQKMEESGLQFSYLAIQSLALLEAALYCPFLAVMSDFYAIDLSTGKKSLVEGRKLGRK